MDIKQLRNFVSVADQKSFSKAATNLSLSQPALSLSIRNLERELDSKLFVRTRKAVTLTETGSQLLMHARAALREIEKAEDVIALSNKYKQQTVKVGLSSLFSNFIAHEVFPTFFQKNKDVSVEIEVTAHDLETTLNRVSSGLWDFGVVLRPIQASVPKDIVSEPLLNLTSSVHTNKEHPLVNDRSVTLEKLGQYAWVMSTVTDGRAIRSAFLDHGLMPPKIIGRVNSFNFIMAVVGAGDYITVLPNEIVKRYFNDRLTTLDTDEFNFEAAVDIIYSKDLELTKVARQLKKNIEQFIHSHR